MELYNGFVLLNSLYHSYPLYSNIVSLFPPNNKARFNDTEHKSLIFRLLFLVRYLSYVVLQVFWTGQPFQLGTVSCYMFSRVEATICAPSWYSSILEWQQALVESGS